MEENQAEVSSPFQDKDLMKMTSVVTKGRAGQ
jgi:hypothetical protein